MVDIQIV